MRWTNWKGILRPPKTSAGLRTIPLVKDLVDLLWEHRKQMEIDRHPGLKRDLVFPNQDGELIRGTPLNPVLKKACKEAGVTIRFTPHGLRRSWNNIARRLAGGLVVRAMIGHASEAMTDHYSHVDMDEKRATTEAVAREIRPDDEQDQPTEEQARQEPDQPTEEQDRQEPDQPTEEQGRQEPDQPTEEQDRQEPDQPTEEQDRQESGVLSGVPGSAGPSDKPKPQ